VAVEHHVLAALDLEVLQAGLQRERGFRAARMAPHHRAGIAHKAAEVQRRRVVGAIQLAPAHAFLPRLHRALDCSAVERGGAPQKLDLGGSLHSAREHQRVVRIRHRCVLEPKPLPEGQVVEADPAALEAELVKRAGQGRFHVEGVALARASYPFQLLCLLGDKPLDVLALRWPVDRHHDRAERPDVAHPRRLAEEGREVVVGDHEDRMVRSMARQQQRVRPRLVCLVRDAVEAAQVEHVERGRDHDAVEAARGHGGQQPLQIAEALRQRFSVESIHVKRCATPRLPGRHPPRAMPADR
jgi:hypothetical protein